MRIAQLAPLFESVPPKFYGGTERVVSYLTEELVRQGHEVTLFASGDSLTSARLIPIAPRALRLDRKSMDPLAHHILLLERALQLAEEYDIIHNHMDYLPFPMLRRVSTPSVTTLHGRLDIPDLLPLYQEFGDIPVISISNNQRKPLPAINWLRTVHHGLPEGLYKPHLAPGSYLAFIGRISPEKGVEPAVEIARKAGIPLKVAAKIDPVDRDYFETSVRQLFSDPGVEYIGEIDELEKNNFLGNALALLFPILWPEPFGMTMIEAMACGTPTIAFHRGSVLEVITNGLTGFVVDSVQEAVAAIDKAAALNRQSVRRAFEEKFSAVRMADDYLSAYRQLTSRPAPLHHYPDARQIAAASIEPANRVNPLRSVLRD